MLFRKRITVTVIAYFAPDHTSNCRKRSKIGQLFCEKDYKGKTVFDLGFRPTSYKTRFLFFFGKKIFFSDEIFSFYFINILSLPGSIPPFYKFFQTKISIKIAENGQKSVCSDGKIRDDPDLNLTL